MLPEATCRITLDGIEFTARQGQSVAAALIEAGRRSWRHTRHGNSSRGVFCGMGVCFDCLIVLNGTPNVRACVTTVEDGDVITAQEGTGHDHLIC